jgi:hypothetical protein
VKHNLFLIILQNWSTPAKLSVLSVKTPILKTNYSKIYFIIKAVKATSAELAHNQLGLIFKFLKNKLIGKNKI